MAANLKDRLLLIGVPKRLVIESDGHHSIVGVHPSEDIPVELKVALNEEMTAFTLMGLIKVKPRYALYRPIRPASVNGRLNDTFDPRQV